MSKIQSKSAEYSDNLKSEQIGIMNEVADKVRSAGRTVREFSDDTQEKVMELREAAESRLRANPLSTSAIIFASGIILGAILRRR